jgi:hypothetical protein
MEEGEEQPNLDETNEERLKRLEKLAEEKEWEEKVAKAESQNLIDVEELVNYAVTKKKLVLPSIGGYVMYCPLRIEDRAEIMKIKDSDPDVQLDKRNRHTVYLMLKRADERWTQELAYNLPAAWVDAILIEYGKEEQDRFLLPVLRRRLDGLRETRRRRK